uniref:SCP domain-containing protein n=1 Tax=Panagrolaimus davidi TaxID=227884 RepID=A0A914QTC3_9BILA
MWQHQILLILSIFYIHFSLCEKEDIYTSNRCLNILNDTHRDLIIDEHNILRSQIINGKSNIKEGIKAPKGKNMYKLYYNCDLEKSAQEWANECIWDHSDLDVGENLFMIGAENYNKIKTIFMAIEDWWKELENVSGGISANNTIYSRALSNLRIGHWSQISWAKTTFVGCGYKSCENLNDRTILVCHYLPQGNVINRSIYEIGNPCKFDGDCETYPFSTCENSTGLCDRFILRNEIISEPILIPKEPTDAEEIELNEVKYDVLENLNQNITALTFEKSKFVETFEDLPNFGNFISVNFFIIFIICYLSNFL